MKYVLLVCTMLAPSMMAYGQQPGIDPNAATPREQQVVVQLQIAEVSLTKLQHSGFDLARVTGEGDAKANTDRATFNAQWAAITMDGIKAQRLLESLRKDSLAKLLAEPTLVTVSGRTTVFHSGGELSVPRPQPDGSVAIEREYGTMVELTPEVLDEQVDLAIRGRLSELDYSHTMRVGNENLPGVRFLEFCTRTKLNSGQIGAMSGPVQVRVEAISRGVPYVSELPYFGALFRFVKEQRNEVAVLILVRPEIVSSSAKAVLPANASPQGETPAGQPASLNSLDHTLPETARRPMKTR
ncbi:MAG: type II and III secretion system protein family protein [Pirellulaceae bacterium]